MGSDVTVAVPTPEPAELVSELPLAEPIGTDAVNIRLVV